jgi:hypothetical protein
VHLRLSQAGAPEALALATYFEALFNTAFGITAYPGHHFLQLFLVQDHAMTTN